MRSGVASKAASGVAVRLPISLTAILRAFLPLREALAEYLGAARGVVCNAHQIVIAPGAQAAVSIATLALTDIGDRVWVENPGYDAAYR